MCDSTLVVLGLSSCLLVHNSSWGGWGGGGWIVDQVDAMSHAVLAILPVSELEVGGGWCGVVARVEELPHLAQVLHAVTGSVVWDVT